MVLSALAAVKLREPGAPRERGHQTWEFHLDKVEALDGRVQFCSLQRYTAGQHRLDGNVRGMLLFGGVAQVVNGVNDERQVAWADEQPYYLPAQDGTLGLDVAQEIWGLSLICPTPMISYQSQLVGLPEVKIWTGGNARLPLEQVTIARRVPGDENGGHVHRGYDKAKDPEMLAICGGTTELLAWNEREWHCHQCLPAKMGPFRVDIARHVSHEVKYNEPCWLAELRMATFDPNNHDCHPPASYPAIRVQAPAYVTAAF